MTKTVLCVALVVATGCSKKTKSDGETYSSADGHFSVMFPHGGKGVEKTFQDVNKLHGDVTWHEVKSDVGAYAVMYTDFADAATAQQDIEDYGKIMGDRVKATRDVTVAGHKARELEMKISDTATMWIQMFNVDKREYRVSA